MNTKTEPTSAGYDIRVAGRHGVNTWQAVQREILRRIREHQWLAGQLIPTEHELARELGCARATVNRALSQLARDGIVERRRRVGTRVSDRRPADSGAEVATIRDEVEASGARYGYRLDAHERVAAPDDVADAMHVSRGTQILRYVAVITADDLPYCAEVGYLVAGRTAQAEALSHAEPLEWMRDHVERLAGRIEILATRLTGECAALLAGEKGLPVLTIDRTLWCDGRALSHSRRVYVPGHRASLVP
ncbi:MAG: GntR family transcriptional regulator [Paracoccus sp. (in: a-proteobacteria)]|nr:GntR family transcriptional regulator [Paracoccus sp. (in: a-proteobacteria)]